MPGRLTRRDCVFPTTLSHYVTPTNQNIKKNETASPALFFAGLCNVITGLVWDLPIPVQPMKSIAAVALVQALNPAQVTTAGIWMGIILTFVGVSNAIELVQGFIPPAVISGMQLGVGLSLAIKGMHVVSALPSLGQVDCQLLALVCSIGCILLLRERRSASTTATTPSQTSTTPPVGLYLFLLGAILSIGSLIQNPHEMANKDSSIRWSFQPWSIITWALKDASWTDWRIGLLDGALPQLPLSVLVRIFFLLTMYLTILVTTKHSHVGALALPYLQNSVISVCCLADSLYPERRDGTRNQTILPRWEVCVSVGIMNLFLCPLGAMPNCHGAGGLAGQHKFGARYGTSVIFLGCSKMLIALVLGSLVLPFLERIPSSIMGVMLALAGLELALTGYMVMFNFLQTDMESTVVIRSNHEQRRIVFIVLLTASVLLGLNKTHYGVIAGLAVHVAHDPACFFAGWSGNIGGSTTRGGYMEGNTDSVEEIPDHEIHFLPTQESTRVP